MKQSVRPADAFDDQQNWKSFLSGDVNAFGLLMSQHFQTLFQYGSKFSKDREFVKDSIQDLFLKLWEKRENLSADAVVKPYLMASLRRHMHRTAIERSKLGNSTEPDEDQLFNIAFFVEQDYIESESSMVLAEKLKTLVDQLPARQKEVIYLKFFQELDRQQISDIMEVSPQTVSNLLQIAIRQLKKYWRTAVFALIAFVLFA
jgi:RNA polymerase sigma factor (sigma-70 family)